MKKLIFGLFLSTCLFTSIQAQVKIGENPENLHFNSVLELESTSKALVITRMSTLQMNAITPLNGAVIYNTDTRCLHYYNDTEWINLCEAENAGNINLVDNGDNTYTFTNAAGNDITFETPAFTSNHTGSGGVGFSSGIKITDDGNTVNIEVDQIHGNSILNKTIGRTKIADDAIGVDELGDTSVNTNNLIDESVTPVKIQPSATPNQVLKTNATGTNVEWGTLDATNIAGQNLTADDASITFTGTPAGSLLETVGISVADGGITNAKLDKTNIPLSGFGDATTDVSLGGFQINNLANPTLDDDAATKIYVDDAITTASAALAAEVARATAAENANTANITSNDTDIATNTTNITSNDTDITDLQNDKEDSANKSNDGTLADNSATDFPTEQAVKTYVDTQVAASDQVIVSTDADNDITIGTDEGAFYDDAALQTNIANNATAITTETTRATNAENAIQTDVDANETAANTAIALKEDSANKSNDGTLADNSATDFPTEQAVKTYVDNQVSAGATALATKEDTANKSNDGSLTDNSATDFPTEQAVKTYVDNQISTINTITDGNILVGDATNTAAQVAISGDATLANTGALTIENNAITSAKILDDEIVNADINPAAAIDGTKINPTFGAQNISTTGTLATGNTTVTGTLDITGQTTINTGANSTTLPLIRGNDGQVLTTDGVGAATWKNPTTGIPTSTPGAIFFSDGTGTLEEMRNAADTRLDVIWDDTNKRLGIGTNTPENKLHVAGAIRSEGILNSDGSTTEPGYRFSDDTNTGMYSPAADKIGFSVGGTQALKIEEDSDDTNVTVNGAFSTRIKSINTVTTAILEVDEHTVIFSGTVTNVTFPASASLGQVLILKNLTGGSITINATVSYIPSASTTAISILPVGVTQLQYDGTNWQQIN